MVKGYTGSLYEEVKENPLPLIWPDFAEEGFSVYMEEIKLESKVILFGVDGLIPELLDRFIGEGCLPNLRKFKEQGSGSRLLPFISTWGDVNFVSLLTGQSPGISWKGQGFPNHEGGQLLQLITKSQKKSALVHFPKSINAGEKDFVFAPFQSGVPPFELASPAVYCSVKKSVKTKGRARERLGWPPKETLAHHEKHNQREIYQNGESSCITIEAHDGSALELGIEPLSGKQIKLYIPDHKHLVVTCGEWTEWTTVTIGNKTGNVRFKLADYDRACGKIALIQSQITLQESLSNDSSLERLLISRCGPFISKWALMAAPDEPYIESSFEEGEYQANWLVNAALYLLEQGIDMFATVFRLNDETHHTCLSECDPSSPHYSPSRAVLCEQTIRRSYEILDQAIGDLLQKKTVNTQLILVSDHGNVPNAYVCDIYRRLEQFGLVTLDDEGLIDRDKSQAYMKDERGGLEIYVNLWRPGKKGVVREEDYHQVQTSIFKALTTWYIDTTQGQKNVIALTLKKQDATIIGYWGEDAGDVIFAYNQGFVWGSHVSGTTVSAVSVPSANHGPQIPSASTGYASNYGIAIMHGSCFKRGGWRDDTKLGPYFMNDLGTTIAKLLEVSNRGNLDGRLMNDLLV